MICDKSLRSACPRADLELAHGSEEYRQVPVHARLTILQGLALCIRPCCHVNQAYEGRVKRSLGWDRQIAKHQLTRRRDSKLRCSASILDQVP